MVQVDISSGMDNKTFYLPYAAGLLVANAWKDEKVSEKYSFGEFFFKRENPEEAVKRLQDPYAIGFSCYSWNTEYNKAFAKKAKELYPDCIIMFGGHNVPPDDSFLRELPYVDILMHGEGEETFRKLLIALDEGDISGIDNITYRSGDDYISTPSNIPLMLEEYPSPYLEGWFDEIVKDTSIHWNAIIETSRGCPHQCAYCDWALLRSKIRYFPLDRVKAEIRWFAEHRIEFLWGADSNFGSRETDIEIVEALADVKRETGYPERIRINYSKNHPDRVLRIVKLMRENDFDRLGATLSFQSMSPKVLEAIGRKNMSLDFFRDLVTRYNKEGLMAYSELILGLPEETYQSYIEGLSAIFELGQHFSFDVYHCNILPNSLLGRKDYMEKYKFKTVDVEPFRAHAQRMTDPGQITEYMKIVVETSTLSREEWIRAAAYYEMLRTFHSFGFLRPLSIYLYYEKNVRYWQFYNGILDYCESNPDLFISGVYRKIKRHFTGTSLGHEYSEDFFFEPTGEIEWPDSEYFCFRILQNMDLFFEEIAEYTLKNFDIDKDILNELFDYEKALVRMPGKESSRVSLEYDIHSFIQNAYLNTPVKLEKRKNTIDMRDSAVIDNWFDYAKYVIWYGRLSRKANMDEIKVTYTD